MMCGLCILSFPYSCSPLHAMLFFFIPFQGCVLFVDSVKINKGSPLISSGRFDKVNDLYF